MKIKAITKIALIIVLVLGVSGLDTVRLTTRSWYHSPIQAYGQMLITKTAPWVGHFWSQVQ